MTIEKRRKFIINFMFFAIWCLIVFVALKYGLSALAPFAIAFAIAYILKYPIRFIVKKTKFPYKWTAMGVVLIFYSTIGLVISLIVLKVFSKLVSFVNRAPVLYKVHVAPMLEDIILTIEQSVISMDASLLTTLEEMLQQFIQSVGEILTGFSVNAMGLVSSITSSLPGIFVKIVVMIIATFFICVDYEKMSGFFFRQLGDKAKSTFLEIKGYVVGTLFVCIRSYILIMSITFIELSIGLSILGLNNAVLIALLIACFDILPVLGTGGIMIPWVIISTLRGDYSLALGLLIVYIVITIIRNIIEPKIVGAQLGLHPVVTLASMFLGVQLLGAIGLFGFPIGLSLLRHLNEKGIVKIFKI